MKVRGTRVEVCSDGHFKTPRRTGEGLCAARVEAKAEVEPVKPGRPFPATELDLIEAAVKSRELTPEEFAAWVLRIGKYLTTSK